MGKVLQFKCKVGFRCITCLKEELLAKGSPLWNFTLPSDSSCSLWLIKYRNGWVKSAFVEKNDVALNKIKHVEDEMHFCPECSQKRQD